MRPDRLVVGEVRGAEVCELLTALNTGHDGGAGTLHANSPAEVPARLEALAALGGLSRPALHSQAAAALRVILHVCREPDGRRRLAEIGVVARTPHGIQVLPAWQPTARLAGWPHLADLLGHHDRHTLRQEQPDGALLIRPDGGLPTRTGRVRANRPDNQLVNQTAGPPPRRPAAGLMSEPQGPSPDETGDMPSNGSTEGLLGGLLVGRDGGAPW
jgi:hypothetical protein